MENEIKVRFIVTGFAEKPEVITDLLKIEPTETWRAGDLCSRQYAPTRRMVGQLVSQTDTTTGVGEVSCIVYLYDYTPVLGLSREAIRRLAQLGASLDYDLYDMGSKAVDD